MAESGLPGVREDDARVMESGYVGRDDRGVAVLHAPGRNQDHAGKAELRTSARHEGRYRGAVGDAPMAMGADHQQAGAARGLQDRAADVLVVHDHGARLDAVGVSSGARGLDCARGARSIERGLAGRAHARGIRHRDERECVAGRDELRGLLHRVLRAAAVVDRADDPAEAELRSGRGCRDRP